ncbi:MAG: hypothetical protein OEZ06_11235 [Myxococcales bacterium]|nr:hypothetical protein [Myxococcales bacterium]
MRSVRGAVGRESGTLGLRLGLVALALIVGCVDGIEPRQPDASTPAPSSADDAGKIISVDVVADGAPMDAALDGGAGDDASGSSLNPPWFGPSDAAAASCALEVAATCDGPEDCGAGQACCGSFDSASFRYTRIACQDSCTGNDEFPLCSDDSQCGAGLVCRPSLIIPHGFISVCAAALVGSAAAGGAGVAGSIECGEHRCKAGLEQCCLRAEYDFTAMMSMPLPAFCDALGAQCACGSTPPEPPPPVEDQDGGA